MQLSLTIDPMQKLKAIGEIRTEVEEADMAGMAEVEIEGMEITEIIMIDRKETTTEATGTEIRNFEMRGDLIGDDVNRQAQVC